MSFDFDKISSITHIFVFNKILSTFNWSVYFKSDVSIFFDKN